jgi:hypothetical protein
VLVYSNIGAMLAITLDLVELFFCHHVFILSYKVKTVKVILATAGAGRRALDLAITYEMRRGFFPLPANWIVVIALLASTDPDWSWLAWQNRALDFIGQL